MLILAFLIIANAHTKRFDPMKAHHYAIRDDKQMIEIQGSDLEDALKMPGIIATGSFSDQITTQGWAYLAINTSSAYIDSEQAYMAGYFEGYATYQYIYDSYLNLGSHEYSKEAMDYMNKQAAWVLEMINSNPNDSYWMLTNISYSQTIGIYEGYVEGSKSNTSMFLTLEQFFWISYQFEMRDIVSRFPRLEKEDLPWTNLHCSFLLKLVEDDLYISHTTWSSYVSLIRLYKKFNYGYTNSAIQNTKITYSGAPGCVCSGDDFYILSNNRFVGETTLWAANLEVYLFLHYESVPYFLRINTANLAYDTAKTWMNYFFSYRSGTYNNQWLIVDFNNYLNNKANLSNATDIIWMIEELYSMNSAQDLTQSMLIPQGYVASYNEVYNPKLQEYSLNPTTYHDATRHRLFHKYAPGIQNFEDFQTVMRMNNKSDTGNYCEAIASRCDLDRVFGPFGAMDCKATAASMISNMDAYIISGPTTEMTPPFSWNDWPKYADRSYGMDRVYNFSWQYVPGNGFIGYNSM